MYGCDELAWGLRYRLLLSMISIVSYESYATDGSL